MNQAEKEMDVQSVGQYFFEKKLLLCLPHSIEPEDEQVIIHDTQKCGSELPVENKNNKIFWKGLSLTSIIEDQLTHIPVPHRDRWMYQVRLREEFEWYWTDHPSSAIVQRLIAPLSKCIQKVTRVVVTLQIPGVGIKAHRDLACGNAYLQMSEPHSTRIGSKNLTYKGDSWFPSVDKILLSRQHEKQGYLSLKIPITERLNLCGKPFIVHGGKKNYYSSERSLFFLNEVEALHGADAVDYYRGLILINGLFDYDAILKLQTFPAKILHIENCDGK